MPYAEIETCIPEITSSPDDPQSLESSPEIPENTHQDFVNDDRSQTTNNETATINSDHDNDEIEVVNSSPPHPRRLTVERDVGVSLGGSVRNHCSHESGGDLRPSTDETECGYPLVFEVNVESLTSRRPSMFASSIILKKPRKAPIISAIFFVFMRRVI
nr:hypothetical protein Iba_chr12dCG12640 [Ipomoea batatas]